ncbi:hypothetical protein XM38_018630 [Halomicronema hongdechloris C2206]|uniref:Uncharacterized protein n=1 Tax=Halomicronema hongdechloris C2206 TaxID=1641165 RepID=A0A1Z3HKU8_9CYAN|nr:tetratricopeptide repeat protein [Halomicronema hongdechloris]ASC70915.1 hypothetical protein XM38_018630 [Halomicronema hongdechloris C2206]
MLGSDGWARWSRWLWLWGLIGGLACTPERAAIPYQAAAPSARVLQTLAYPPFWRDPATAARYRRQGLAYRAAQQYDRAIATLQIATALDPDAVAGWVILGWTQHLAGDTRGAIATLQTALARIPEHVPALNALGIVYLVQGDLSAAVNTHQRAIALQPDNEVAHYNLSLAYDRLNRPQAAIQHAQTATQLAPDNPHHWLALALAQIAATQPAAAREAYQKAIRQDSRYRQADFLAHLSQAGFSTPQIDRINHLRTAIVD